MKKKVTVIDYGVGNLLSVIRALEYCDADVTVSDKSTDISNAEKVVLPGVGAFSDGMDGLRERNLIEPIKKIIEKGRHLLGICLGMQMLMDSSEEFGLHTGLGLIKGKVVRIFDTGINGKPHLIPNIGWRSLKSHNGTRNWQQPLLFNIQPGVSTYFVHSYMALPDVSENIIADCDYNGRKLSAVISSENIHGCQFHPEKSGPVGLNIIKNFIWNF